MENTAEIPPETLIRRSRRRLTVVGVLLVINLLVFMCWEFAGEAGLEFMIDNFLVSWTGLAEGRIWILLTSVFSHNMLLHILMNMFVLTSFGPIVEQTLGSMRFLRFYLVAGIISSFAHAAVSAWIIGDPSIPALGASGAIAGMILLFCLFYPREKILLFAFIPVPAFVGAALFVGLDIWGLVAQAEGGGLPIGHGAHLGGAFTGICYYLYLRAKLRKAIARQKRLGLT